MSDNIDDITKVFNKDVLEDSYCRSIGLFSIPEYPEFERGEEGMWSVALETILTTLRYLAPATLLTLFWGQQSFLFRILKAIDLAIRTIIFSSNQQKEAAIKWIAEVGPVELEDLDTVWSHGWILCSVLDAALPGACAGHPPTSLSMKHAQTIADHYLGVEPVFSRQELESIDSLSRHQEWKLAHYLERIREALARIPPPVSKPSSQRTSPEATQLTLDYLARGTGLTAAQINQKMFFKIYPTTQQSLEPGEITVLIKGPKDMYGMLVVPPILGKAQMIRQKLLDLQPKHQFTGQVLPLTQGATYYRNYGHHNMNKTYHIPKTKYNIEMESETSEEYVKIGYVVKLEGQYNISVTSSGLNIVGSPFTVTASENIDSTLEKEDFTLEDCEQIDLVDGKTDRKVVLRIVDFVTEKMLLKEDGEFEKITDDEAKLLMTMHDGKVDDESNLELNYKPVYDDIPVTTDVEHKNKFKTLAIKVSLMIKICRRFINILKEKEENEREICKILSAEIENKPVLRNQNDIPDVVNSTFCGINSYIVPEKLDKILVPEKLCLSLEVTKEQDILEDSLEINSEYVTDQNFIKPGFKNEDISHNKFVKSTTLNNQFLNEEHHSFSPNTDTEISVNNNELTEKDNLKSPFSIILNNADSSKNVSTNTNPFEIHNIERPKTPILKILQDDLSSRDESVYADLATGIINEEILRSNEFLNPFFVHHHKVEANLGRPDAITDFKIGAPVTLPPIIKAPTPEPNTDYLNASLDEDLYQIKLNDHKNMTHISDFDNKSNDTDDDILSRVFSTPLHPTFKQSMSPSLFHNLDSEILTVQINHPSSSDINQKQYHIVMRQPEHTDASPKKETWDSAYVSIDENMGSPDGNNNDNSPICSQSNKINLLATDRLPIELEDFSKMGPAEKEIWRSCEEVSFDLIKPCEEIRSYKWDHKRPIFTPIEEESERCLSATLNECKDSVDIFYNDNDAVAVAFAELDEYLEEYCPNSENSSLSYLEEKSSPSLDFQHTIEMNKEYVDSASAIVPDVMRQTIHEPEGKISRVQTNATESAIVSQNLQVETKESTHISTFNNCTKFGDTNKTNIVLEKKKYWDEKIRHVEEMKIQQAKKRKHSTSKLKLNGSLTRRKGKQIAKNFLVAGDTSCIATTTTADILFLQQKAESTTEAERNAKADENLVDKWKKYWDEKLENLTDHTYFEPKLPNKPHCLELSKPPNDITLQIRHKIVEAKHDNAQFYKSSSSDGHMLINAPHAPLKKEIPEEVFKAFETSPKRFFGTSRINILNKIDAFVETTNVISPETSKHNLNTENRGTGLVSSRINLFHSIANVEELPWKSGRSNSTHSISNSINSEKSGYGSLSCDHSLNMMSSPIAQILRSGDKCGTNFETSRSTSSSPNRVPISPDLGECELIQHQIVNNDRILYDRNSHSSLGENNNQNQKDEDRIHVSTQQKTNTNQIAAEPINTIYVKKAIKDLNKSIPNPNHKLSKLNSLKTSSVSKSEMDIFNKVNEEKDEDNLEKHKSYDELPKINVKNFISLYESVSKSNVLESKLIRRFSRTNSTGSEKNSHTLSFSSNIAAATSEDCRKKNREDNTMILTKSPETCLVEQPKPPPRRKWIKHSTSQENVRSTDSIERIKIIKNENTLQPMESDEEACLSLSDIEIEIIENNNETTSQSHIADNDPTDYKSRFMSAKQYFKSREELNFTEEKKTKLNKCETLLLNLSTESLEDQHNESITESERPHKRTKKKIKARSLPSSELAKIWDEFNEINEASNKLVKISEKFNVEDLFNDVTEGKLSRQGSLRGIPHKKAVLEALRSMENLSDGKLSPYEMAVSQLNEYAKEKKIKNAQTYLTEYPYLPTTDPARYHSRLDVKASGLISMKELKHTTPRRNSVPDIKISFTVDL